MEPSDKPSRQPSDKSRRVLLVMCLLVVLGYVSLTLCRQRTTCNSSTYAFVSAFCCPLYREAGTMSSGGKLLQNRLQGADPKEVGHSTEEAGHSTEEAGLSTGPLDHSTMSISTDSSDNLASRASRLMARMLHKLEPDLKLPLTNDNSLNHSYNSVTNGTGRMKVILFWTRYPSQSWEWEFGLGHQPFIKHKCPISNCMTTHDKSLVKQASAVAINLRTNVLPSVRFPNQTYVIHLRESPSRRSFSQHFNGAFNVTMTYRADSDIPVPYGAVIPGNSSRIGHSDELRMLVKGKSKLVAWFVSNCQTPSKREQYVKQLQRYIPVDIYGACGSLKCPHISECLDMVEQDYKFYLAFENSVCTQYITEKSYNILQRYIVPVVYGGANYSLHTPPHSVINVRDFKSPKHLATYLKGLAGDERKYMDYFKWKKHYSILKPTSLRVKSFCKLCEILNDPHRQKHGHEKLWQWWFKRTCSKPLSFL